jgi:hypothetical protein
MRALGTSYSICRLESGIGQAHWRITQDILDDIYGYHAAEL